MRDKLIELLTRRLTEIYGESAATQIIALQIAGELLAEGMLSADLVRHGRWIKPTKINGRSFSIVHCSVCGGVPCGVDENTRYCPNCGAKMDLEDAK